MAADAHHAPQISRGDHVDHVEEMLGRIRDGALDTHYEIEERGLLDQPPVDQVDSGFNVREVVTLDLGPHAVLQHLLRPIIHVRRGIDVNPIAEVGARYVEAHHVRLEIDRLNSGIPVYPATGRDLDDDVGP